jgi:hypothetical protein
MRAAGRTTNRRSLSTRLGEEGLSFPAVAAQSTDIALVRRLEEPHPYMARGGLLSALVDRKVDELRLNNGDRDRL